MRLGMSQSYFSHVIMNYDIIINNFNVKLGFLLVHLKNYKGYIIIKFVFLNPFSQFSYYKYYNCYQDIVVLILFYELRVLIILITVCTT